MLPLEDMVIFPYPDTDYPIGHPNRSWGTLTTTKQGASELITQQTINATLSKSEANFIMASLGKENH